MKKLDDHSDIENRNFLFGDKNIMKLYNEC